MDAPESKSASQYDLSTVSKDEGARLAAILQERGFSFIKMGRSEEADEHDGAYKWVVSGVANPGVVFLSSLFRVVQPAMIRYRAGTFDLVNGRLEVGCTMDAEATTPMQFAPTPSGMHMSSNGFVASGVSPRTSHELSGIVHRLYTQRANMKLMNFDLRLPVKNEKPGARAPNDIVRAHMVANPALTCMVISDADCMRSDFVVALEELYGLSWQMRVGVVCGQNIVVIAFVDPYPVDPRGERPNGRLGRHSTVKKEKRGFFSYFAWRRRIK